MDQSKAKRIDITTTGAGGQVAKLTFEDADGNDVQADASDAKLVAELKYIRDQWAAGKEVKFTFEVSSGFITSLTVSANKP
jgi:hypothetical protein